MSPSPRSDCFARPLTSAELNLLYADDGVLFDALWKQCEASIRRRVSRFARQTSDAEELLEDVRIHAWIRRSRYRGQGTFTGWLFTLCDHYCVDLVRRRRVAVRRTERAARETSLVVEQTPPDGREAREDVQPHRSAAVRIALGALPVQDRQIAVERWVKGRKPADIAHSLGLKPSSMWTRLSKIKRTLRIQIETVLAAGERRVGR